VAESISAKRPERGAAIRELVLSASTTVFAIHGYHRTTIEQLLGAAGIDRATFDGLFRDKEDCFLAAFEQLVELARECLLASMPNDAAWPQRLASALARLFELIAANPAAARLVLVEAPAAGAESISRYMATVSRVAPFMADGRVQGDSEAPPIVDTAIPGGVAYVLGAHVAQGRPHTAPLPLPRMGTATSKPRRSTPTTRQAPMRQTSSSAPSLHRGTTRKRIRRPGRAPTIQIPMIPSLTRPSGPSFSKALPQGSGNVI
jgi:AcrR family transcriptional regulator